jgi:Domain of unknown function (DUF4352)
MSYDPSQQQPPYQQVNPPPPGVRAAIRLRAAARRVGAAAPGTAEEEVQAAVGPRRPARRPPPLRRRGGRLYRVRGRLRQRRGQRGQRQRRREERRRDRPQPARARRRFEFTVTSVKCGATSVGSDLLGQKAQGEYCLVDVTVRNIGDAPQTFDGSSQKAFDAQGAEYSNDGVAEMYANEGNATFLENINPGNQVKGRLVFDVPKDTTLTELMLHDSPFSGGVRVNLA